MSGTLGCTGRDVKKESFSSERSHVLCRDADQNNALRGAGIPDDFTFTSKQVSAVGVPERFGSAFVHWQISFETALGSSWLWFLW